MNYELKELDNNIDFTNEEECTPLDWDVVITSNGWREIIIKDSEIPGYDMDSEHLEFSDYNIEMKVYKIDSYPHSYSNGPHTMYICERDEEPSAKTLRPFDDADWSIWGINCKPKVFNRGDEVSAAFSVEITRNGELFDTISGRDMAYCLVEAQHMLNELVSSTTPFRYHIINYEEEIVGTSLKYKGKLTTITDYIKGQNAIMLDLVASEDDYDPGEQIKTSVLDKDIDWFF